MKRTRYRYLVTGMSLALFLSGSAISSDSPIPSETSSTVVDAATELLQSSGMSEQLHSLPRAVIESFEQAIAADGLQLPFEDEDVPYLRSTLTSVFNSERLQRAVAVRLRAGLAEPQFEALMRFYQGEHGQQIRDAEIANSILRHRDRFNLWYVAGGFHALSDARRIAIQDLEEALQATDSAVDTLISMQVALQLSLSPALPAEHRSSARELISSAKAHRPQLTRLYRESSLESIAFLYQQLSLDTLHAFTGMLETQAGQRYVQALNLGLSHGMLDAAEALGESMKPLLLRRLGQGA